MFHILGICAWLVAWFITILLSQGSAGGDVMCCKQQSNLAFFVKLYVWIRISHFSCSILNFIPDFNKFWCHIKENTKTAIIFKSKKMLVDSGSNVSVLQLYYSWIQPKTIHGLCFDPLSMSVHSFSNFIIDSLFSSYRYMFG